TQTRTWGLCPILLSGRNFLDKSFQYRYETSMKIRVITFICLVAFLLASVNSSSAANRNDPAVVAADALLVLPVCFFATVIGRVFVVVSLPVAATSGSVHRAADSLVVGPAKATFTRPLGDVDDLLDF